MTDEWRGIRVRVGYISPGRRRKTRFRSGIGKHGGGKSKADEEIEAHKANFSGVGLKKGAPG